jgi:hypothetical protein
MLKFFKNFNASNLDFGPVVIFLDCPFHHGHRAYSKCDGRMNADQSGKVRIRLLDSDPIIQQLLYAPKHKNWTCTGTVQNVDLYLDAGSVVQCCTGCAYSHGTRAKADVQIRTSGLDPHLIF